MRPLVTQEAGNTPQHAQRFDRTCAISEPISDVEPVPPADGALVPGPWQQLQAWKPLRVGPDAVPESRRTTVHADHAVGDTRGIDSGAITTDDDIERVLPRRFIRLGGLLGPVRRVPPLVGGPRRCGGSRFSERIAPGSTIETEIPSDLTSWRSDSE